MDLGVGLQRADLIVDGLGDDALAADHRWRKRRGSGVNETSTPPFCVIEIPASGTATVGA